MDINVLICYINGRVGIESNFFFYDICCILICCGIVVKSQDFGIQFCYIIVIVDIVCYCLVMFSGDGEQVIIDNGSIIQVFLFVDVECAVCINVELFYKAVIIVI